MQLWFIYIFIPIAFKMCVQAQFKTTKPPSTILMQDIVVQMWTVIATLSASNYF